MDGGNGTSRGPSFVSGPEPHTASERNAKKNATRTPPDVQVHQVTVKRQRLNIKREDLLTNSDTLYKSLNLLLWPLLRRYNVSFILSMMECMSVVNCLFYDAVKERKLTKDISDALQATTDAMTRTTAAEANVKVL